MPVSRVTTSLATASLSLALAVLVQPGTGFAYTPEQQQACTPDAMRLCGDFVPNVDAITACMIQKKAQLSPQCAVFFRRGPEPGVGAPTNIAPKPAKKTTKAKASKKKSSDG
ncbi:hypothetical protein KUL72_06550 [Bradyrhizobium arachidis]|uniref:hypothetical protein n=1 Tax=Bradyrhizobium TaxID=374 RepID=UPI002163763B|nr:MULTISPECIES: hypothetical protein [Bradyrhizobium]MDN4983657.1 hypothetical protein [Bradyrhizobium sp. WYCCWR 13022]UVO38039.1 hypothetical protein KUL72_06550 [Bradyrhizobium arachidis]